MPSNRTLRNPGSRASVAYPSLHERIKIDESQPKGTLSKCFYELSHLDVNLIEPSIKVSSSSHRRSVPARFLGANDVEYDDEVRNRGSMYHSSRDIRKLRRQREGKRNAVSSQNDEQRYLSFEIVDASSSSSCLKPSLSFTEQASSPLSLLRAASKSPLRLSSRCTPTTKTKDILDVSFRHSPDENLDACGLCSDFTVERGPKSPAASFLSCFKPEDTNVQDRSMTSQYTESGASEAQLTRGRRVIEHENDEGINLGKAMRSTFFKSFSVKARSYDSPCRLGGTSAKSKPKVHTGSLKMSDAAMKSKSMRNPSLTGSETSAVMNKSHFVGADRTSTSGSSAAHLHGSLRLWPGHGSSFELSSKDPEFLSARTWKMGDSSDSVYTFHRRKSGGRSNSMVGQMHMSCCLCSEANEKGSVETFLVMEFVLYDIARERTRQDAEERPGVSPGSARASDLNDCDSDGLSCYPWTTADLCPHLEVAAIIIRVPLNRGLPEYSSACELPLRNPVKMKVVTPSGTHGSPNEEGARPSSLLDRWRSGGGCDCGGWDMACPVVTFENSGEGPVNRRGGGSDPMMPLFFQGRKEEMPALSVQEKGSREFSVAFHSRLSAMQAFAICIAMLYSSETSLMMAGKEEVYRQQGLLHPKSLTFLLEEELRLLVGAAVSGNESATKKPPPFPLDPPFSPIGRV